MIRRAWAAVAARSPVVVRTRRQLAHREHNAFVIGRDWQRAVDTGKVAA